MIQGIDNSLVNLPAKANPADGRSMAEMKARQAAEDFEAFFLARYFDAMQMGLESDGPMGGGHSEEIFRSVLNDEYAKVISGRGGIGIADAVYREILRIQEEGQGS
jgi:Rod binding domain-containing protein